MEQFQALLTPLLPMMILIAAGFVAGRWLGVRGESIGPLLIYLITPLVIFSAILKIQISLSTLLLPLLITAICCALCLATFSLMRGTLPSPTVNVAAFAAGNANSGYFAIPVGLALFGEQALPYIVLIGFGFLIFENTLGVFMMALGNYSARDAAVRVLKLPTVYAFLLGLCASALGVSFTPQVADFFLMIRHTYSVLGMMLLGLGLAAITNLKLDYRFLGATLAAKHLVWPCVTVAVLWIEVHLAGILAPHEREIVLYMSVLPLAANTVAWATVLKAEPEKASAAVFLSTLLAPVGILLLPVLRSCF